MKERQSNIELMRILAMFFIVIHHYVVNSGVIGCFDYANPSANMVFLLLVGAWGKTAINAFVLITGYFMCESRLTPKRYFKVFLEWMFYAFAVQGVFWSVGYEPFSVRQLVKMCFAPFIGVDRGFAASFVWFYLGIPFYNILLKGLNRKSLLLLIAALIGMFSIPSTLFHNGQVFHHVFWYMTIYFIGAFIRQYPFRWMETNRICLPLLAGTLLATLLTLYGRLICSTLPMKILANVFNVSESCMIMPLALGMLMFLVFKNWRLSYYPLINKIAATMFGVLCIHAASDTMRKVLWEQCCCVPYYQSQPSLLALAGHVFGCAIVIMVTCVIIDCFRIRFLERPLFAWAFKGT